LKVIQVTERFPPAVGGVETHVYHLSQELRKLGVDVRVLTTDLYSTTPLTRLENSKDEQYVTRFKGYQTLPLPEGLGIVAPGMLGHLRDASLVHIHGYGHFPTYLAQYCSKVMRLPVVATTHSDAGRPSIRKRAFDAIVPRLSIRSANKIIAISNHERQVLIHRGIPSERIVVIPNGIDLNEISTAPAHKNPGRTLLYAGRIDIDHKGLDILVEAFARLSKNHPDLQLVLTGPDWNNSIQKLEKLSTKLGVRVHFTGFLKRSDYIETLKSADIFILPSRFEPFGIVLLEAMAAGVPIVAANTGAIPELLEKGRLGLLFKSGNVDSLTKQIENGLSNEAEAKDRAVRARLPLERYSWQKIAQDTLQTYKEVLAKN
jgi:glycosyltransferase involved in cell wall biosynthesis